MPKIVLPPDREALAHGPAGADSQPGRREISCISYVSGDCLLSFIAQTYPFLSRKSRRVIKIVASSGIFNYCFPCVRMPLSQTHHCPYVRVPTVPPILMLPSAPIVCHDSEAALSKKIPCGMAAPCAPKKPFAMIFAQILADTIASGVDEKLLKSIYESPLLITRESNPTPSST